MIPPDFMFLNKVGLDLIYSFVIIVCSFMIFYSTKEMYELTSYKGLKYFRLSFIFFALSYFFRSFIVVLLNLFDVSGILEISPRFISAMTLFLFVYFSTIAVFYLVYSVMWKQWNSPITCLMLHLTALFISLVAMVFRERWIILVVNFVLLLFLIVMLCKDYKILKRKGQNLFVIYILLSIFWVFNIVDILIPRFLYFFNVLVYLISILLFMMILYKVLKSAGN